MKTLEEMTDFEEIERAYNAACRNLDCAEMLLVEQVPLCSADSPIIAHAKRIYARLCERGGGMRALPPRSFRTYAY